METLPCFLYGFIAGMSAFIVLICFIILIINITMQQTYDLGKADSEPKWISIEAELPESNTTILVNVESRGVLIMYYGLGGGNTSYPEIKDYFFLDDDIVRSHIGKYITHWMPLPKQP